MTSRQTYKQADLVFSHSMCIHCGEPLATPVDRYDDFRWSCSAVLLGSVLQDGNHASDVNGFVWKIRKATPGAKP